LRCSSAVNFALFKTKRLKKNMLNIKLFDLGKKAVFSFILIIVLISYFFCRLHSRLSKPIRIIDEISNSNIKESPIIEMETAFPILEETIIPNRVSLLRSENPDIHSLAVYSLLKPVLYLSTDDSIPVHVFQGARELSPSSFEELKPGQWMILNKTRKIAINDRLIKGESRYFEVILPQGKTEFHLTAANPFPKLHKSCISLLVDGIEIGDFFINGKKIISFEAEPGKHSLELVFRGVQSSEPVEDGSQLVLIRLLQIETASDLLLFPIKNIKGDTLIKDPYRVVYRVDPTGLDKILAKNPRLQPLNDLRLAWEEKTSPLYSIENNTSTCSIKRKAWLKDEAIDILFAPPRSEFEVPVKIPEKALLEFGYGLFFYPESAPAETTNYKIIAMIDGEKLSLFNQTIQKEKRSGDIVRWVRKIDLSPYSGKTIKLNFITDNLAALNTPATAVPAQAFWYNPVIYSPRKQEDKYTNVILISIDTLRADHLGCYGYFRNTSPHIDRLAAEGTRFDNPFSPAPWTLPAHVSMLTALNPARHNVILATHLINPRITTLAEILRSKGYFTGAFTGGGYVSASYGHAQGFDFYQDRGGTGKRSAKKLSEWTVKWINYNRDKKFFLFLHTYQTHSPYSAPPPFGQIFVSENKNWKDLDTDLLLGNSRKRYAALPEEIRQNIIALYDGEIRVTDEEFIGPLIAALKNQGLYDRTMIIFTSDHGEEFYDHGSWLHGQSLYNELIRVPLVIKFPFSKYQNRTISNNARLIDIVPTILSELDLKISQKNFDGKSLIPLIEQKEKKQRQVKSEQYKWGPFLLPGKKFNQNLKIFSYIEDHYKLIFSLNSLRYHKYYSPPPPQNEVIEVKLFDLQNDPGETTNVAALHKKKVRRILDKIEKYLSEGQNKAQKSENMTMNEKLVVWGIFDRRVKIGKISIACEIQILLRTSY